MTFWSEEECRNFELGNFFDYTVRLGGECFEYDVKSLAASYTCFLQDLFWSISR